MTPPGAGLTSVVARHRALVCVGTGGVGKTTVAAALALAGALTGRRAAVLTIDPAHQLARALGLSGLSNAVEPVDLASLHGGHTPRGSLHAGMLDQKAAWDAFIRRHAPDPESCELLLDNPFYQNLSTSLAGSAEYMAVEELCQLAESGRYDLIVVDTPPAGHAVDFLRATDRVDRLLDPQVARWLSSPYHTAGRRAFRAMSMSLSYVVHLIEGAAGTRTLREISAFFVALDALSADIAQRASRARELLRGSGTAFVLVTGPTERVLAEGDALMATLRRLDIRLRAGVINRTHPLPPGCDVAPEALEPVLAELAAAGVDTTARGWLRRSFERARAVAGAEARYVRAFTETLPPSVAHAEVPELDHDAHCLEDLHAIATQLGLLTG